MSASMQNNCTQFMFMPRCNINTTQHYQLAVYMSHVMQEYVLTVCDSSNIETFHIILQHLYLCHINMK